MEDQLIVSALAAQSAQGLSVPRAAGNTMCISNQMDDPVDIVDETCLP